MCHAVVGRADVGESAARGLPPYPNLSCAPISQAHAAPYKKRAVAARARQGPLPTAATPTHHPSPLVARRVALTRSQKRRTAERERKLASKQSKASGHEAMAAPSSLASSSHLSRRATAAASPSIPPPSPPHPPQRLRCGWVGRAAPPTRRAPGVCSVVSPSKPGSLSAAPLLVYLALSGSGVGRVRLSGWV